MTLCTGQRPAVRGTGHDRSGTVIPHPLLGRTRERARCLELLQTSQLLTLSGPGGIGKTSLATALLDDLPVHGRCYLASCRDEASVLSALAAALDIPLHAQEPLQHLSVALRERGGGVLFIDNAEQVIDAVAGIVSAIQAAAPRLTILVTSREVLRLPGEQVVELNGLRPADARALFLQTARQPGAASEDPQALSEVLAILDGVPLAVQIAAGRAHVLPLAQLAAYLRRRGLDVSTRTRGVPDRQRSMRATIEWSWSLLSPEEQAVLQQLAVFRRLPTVDVLRLLLQTLPDTEPLQIVEQLQDSSMLGAGAQLMVLVRAFVQENTPPERSAQLQESHARWCLARCQEQAHLHRGVRLARLQQSPGLDDLQAAIGRMATVDAALSLDLQEHALGVSVWCESAQRSEELLSLLPQAQLTAPLQLARRLRLGLEVRAMHDRHHEAPLLRALSLAGAPSEERVRLLLLQSTLTDAPLAEREQAAAEAIEIAEQLRSGLLPNAWFAMMNVNKKQGDDEAVLSWMRRITATPDIPPDLKLDTWVTASGSMFRLGQDAFPILHRAERLAQANGIRREQLKILMQLGVMYANRGEHDKARGCLTEARSGYQAMGSILNICGCWANLGYIAMLQDELEAAEHALLQADGLLVEADAPMYRAINDGHLAILAAIERQWSRADRLFARTTESLSQPSGAGFRAMHALVLERLGQRERAHTELALARASLPPSMRGGVDVCAAIVDHQPVPDVLTPGLFGQFVALLARKLAGPTLIIHEQEGWAEHAGTRIALRKRSGPWALLRALARSPDAVMDSHALFAAGWPGQRIQPAAATHRVHVALSTLRKLGLGDTVSRLDDGYQLAPGLHVEWR